MSRAINIGQKQSVHGVILLVNLMFNLSVARAADTDSAGAPTEDLGQMERAAAALEKEVKAIDELQSLLLFIQVPDSSEPKADIVRSLLDDRATGRPDYRNRVRDELNERARANLTSPYRSLSDETLNQMRATALSSIEIAQIMRSFLKSIQARDSPMSCKAAIEERATNLDIKAKIEQCAKDVEALLASNPLKGALDTASSALTARRTILVTELERRRQQIDQARSVQEKKVDITSTAVTYTVPIVGFLMLLILLGPLVYGKEVQIAIFQNALLLELLTVYLLIATILLLGLSEKIDKNALGTLLGGISGYVLGRTLSSRAQAGGHPAPASGEPAKQPIPSVPVNRQGEMPT